MKLAKFRIKRARNGEYYFTLVAPNGESMDIGETYTRKASCKRAIEAMKKHVFSAVVIDETK